MPVYLIKKHKLVEAMGVEPMSALFQSQSATCLVIELFFISIIAKTQWQGAA